MSSSRKGCGGGLYIWKGQQYRGAAAVAEAAGVNARTVLYHLDRHGDLSRLGIGSGGHNQKPGRRGRQVSLCGRRWNSIQAMAHDLGISSKAAHRYIRAGNVDGLIRALMAKQVGGVPA
ncbi:hypothetical protein pben1_p24 [Paracoccus phage vB_PbeS_Pben1]|uniref:Uncharacterized protein n=1 Tax=Paracoccus versutus TaxID=34007 RepID=A0A3D9XPD4_PARVE|nr:hypothetical protein [Paracoccus versutus]AZV00181.1 hypothetical protein pben1_p24 [Paracoccus phage vB_PbeS_Pben1]REF72294.1 hypothetical protein BDD41_0763 [Paracoccus versutus]WGR55723.1 hypothetical protein E3U25_07035 [Paracoccus versutus]